MSAPDDRPPESGDASHFDFDDLVLDEDFIRAATISEATATARVERKREQEVRRSSRFPRPQMRSVRRRLRTWGSARPDDRRSRPAPDAPHMREWTVTQWVAVLVVVALAGAFVWLLTDISSSAHTAATSSASSAVTPTGDDPVGTCRGIQPSSSGNHVTASRVPCTTSHSVEVTGYVTVSPGVAAQPTTDTAWRRLVGQSCQQRALSYTGGQLQGNFTSGYLPIPTDQWNAGNRNIECTVYAPDTAGNPTPYTGSVRNS
jgi:hypothetical protein